ncbi:MAG: endonuclease/exonuclease/phosphatase family protein [Flavobacteriaceae bacterium]
MATLIRHAGLFCLGFLFLFCETYEPETKTYTVRTIAFYNVENLFDTLNDTLVYDDDRTPEGKDKWTELRYKKKIGDISKVLSGMGADVTGSSPDIIGLCEIEKQEVLEALINHHNLKDKNYGIIHLDSPDERGMDVALLYKRSSFQPISFQSRRLLIYNKWQDRDYTRDQLVVSGMLDHEPIHFIVNHWPSRSGGEARSRPGRLSAAKLNRRIMDSLRKLDPEAKIISMGDLNDNPNDDSIKLILEARNTKDGLAPEELYNPMESLYKKGHGTLAYRDEWSLFDQILISGSLTTVDIKTFTYWKVGIYNPPYLITQTGRYKGYPFRTYAGGSYTGGYSDHFPVYIALYKAAD